MKAIVWTKYGSPDGLKLQEVEKPVPKANEVLVKVHAATVTLGDCEMRSLKLPLLFKFFFRLYMGIRKPRKGKILGQELSGVIEKVGQDVKRFKKDDAILAPTSMNFGAYAEYTCLPDSLPISLKPENISFEQAATIPTGGLNSLHFITKKARVQTGEKILINGAGGSIGTYGLQIAKSLGAPVTCVDSGEKLEMLTDLGADAVIDYTKTDFTATGKKYDVIIDVVGKCNFSKTVKSLTKNGRYVLGNPSLLHVFRGLWVSWFTSKNVFFELAPYKQEHLDELAQLMEKEVIKAVIDRHYSMEQTPDAHRYVEQGLKKGNVVIKIK